MNKRGLIIIGYPGIGKTSVSSSLQGIIDLNSSIFTINNEHFDGWESIYCRSAIHLANQGYTVLVSSHYKVVQKLKEGRSKNNYYLAIVCPSIGIKKEWIDRLEHRYNSNKSKSNYDSLIWVKENYNNDIVNLTGWIATTICIDRMDYNFSEIVTSLQKISSSKVHYNNDECSIRFEGC